jgi:TolB-like protein
MMYVFQNTQPSVQRAFTSLFALAIACFLIIPTSAVFGQNAATNRDRVAVLGIDAKGFPAIEPAQMSNIVRTELDRIGKFEVIDRYDVEYLLKNSDLKADNCFGKECLVDVGKKIRADKMLSGSVELYGERIFVNLRLIDVGTATVERTKVVEFLNLRGQLPMMVGLALQKMFDQPVDNETFTKLTKKFDYENLVNNPEQDRLNLSGPRMGFTYFTGESSAVLQSRESLGGFNANPLMFQFGYQFEVQYLNQGSFQALFEFIPMVTGLDQGKFLPSISILNGMRSNISGWELAFGPVFYMTQRSTGYRNTTTNEWQMEKPTVLTGWETESRFDSRGERQFDTGFVFAVGKSFKSGKLNIPVNAFFIPRRDGNRIGISVGFNAKR